MAWNIAGMGRRTRDAAEEAARRAGMRLDDWLDEAIADRAAEHSARPEEDDSADEWLDAIAGRLERLSEGKARDNEARARDVPDSFDAAIERFEKRLARSEARAARALESVARILEGANPIRESDQQASLKPAAEPEEAKGNRIAAEPDRLRRELAAGSAPAKPRIDLKTAVSQIAMRRQELNARADRRLPEAQPADPGSAASASKNGAAPAAPALVKQKPGELDAGARIANGPTHPLVAPPAPDGRLAASHTESLREDVRALARKLDDMRRERAEQDACAIGVGALRVEIAAMSRSLADLAPRNAVVALEGAIGDLMHRVEMMRQSGHGESLLAPLDAMAADLRAALKAHDPQAAVAGLEREIRAIGGKIDGLATSAINPETLERIRQQTEEVRALLASAALRTAPLERMERQIGELADRVERLGASPAPHFESAEMAAFLAEARLQIERLTPPAALQSIERRLERIAARLDQELARSPTAAIDPRPFDELARRIDGVRQSLEQRSPIAVDTRPIEKLLRDFDAKLDAASRRDDASGALQLMIAEVSDKLDRLSTPEAGMRWLEPALSTLNARLDAVSSPVDLGPTEAMLHQLQAKLDASGAAMDSQIAEHVAKQVARRLEDFNAGQVGTEALAEQIANIHDRIDALAGETARASELEPVVRELLERLRELGAPPISYASETSAAIRTVLTAQLSELRAEQAGADRRTQTSLVAVQEVLERLAARLQSIESDLAGDIDRGLSPVRPANPRTAASSALPGVDALGPDIAPQRFSQPKPLAAAEEGPPASASSGEDFLLEPGAGAPMRAREARELAQAIGPKTNSAVSAHIAAARRAAHAALAENGAAPPNDASVTAVGGHTRPRLAARSVENARAFYASHRRTVLLGVALLIAATLAVRLVGVRAPFLQRSEMDGQAVKAARVDAPEKPLDLADAINAIGRAVDAAPTASIAPAPAKPSPPDLPPADASSPTELLSAIPAGTPQLLRDAVAAGASNAEYELAVRLFEGRGASKDQQAAAFWFQRAATLGLAPAQYRLAAMYEKGTGVARDPAAAKRWYLKAAEAGNARAAHNLAVMNAEPVSDKPDYGEAAKWFRKAGELGVRDSQFNLAILYARGLGVEQDLRQSWLWFSLAAQQGDADAAKKRDEVAAKMDPASLAAAADALAKFKPVKPDQAANEVSVPPGGWDAKPGSAPLSQSPPGPSAGPRPQTPL